MKTTAACYQALLDGETLVSRNSTHVTLRDGVLVNPLTGSQTTYNFAEPEYWQIYRAPEWWEKIKEPVLCYVIDTSERTDTMSPRILRVIKLRQEAGKRYFVDTRDVPWTHATPVPKEELLKMIAALEAVEGEA